MFLKQTSYKPRTASQSSGSSDPAAAGAGLSGSPPKETKPTDTGPVSAAFAGRRRSSASEGLFGGLQGHKRTGSSGEDSAKKASFAEQKPGGAGVLGGMWNSFTKGS